MLEDVGGGENGRVQAVQDDRDLLAVLGAEDVVDEGRLAGAEVAYRERSANIWFKLEGRKRRANP